MSQPQQPERCHGCQTTLTPIQSKIGECAIQAAIAAGVEFMRAFMACMTGPTPPPPPPPDAGDDYQPGERHRCP